MLKSDSKYREISRNIRLIFNTESLKICNINEKYG